MKFNDKDNATFDPTDDLPQDDDGNPFERAVRYEGTSQDLHRYFKKFQIANPQIDNPAQLIQRAVQARWPGVDPRAVMEAAEINWLREDRENMARDEARDLNKWVDTTVQGDLFNQFHVRVPKFVIVDGQTKRYDEIDPLRMLAYLQAREAAANAEADALQAAADEKRRVARETHVQIEMHKQLLKVARDNGIDPSTVRYAHAED